MTEPLPGRIRGIVLAGGRSRRMGSDKALQEVAGRSLLSRTVARLAPQCREVAVSRHDGRQDGVDAGLAVLRDAVPGQAGPLAGILAGLDWAAGIDPTATHIVTVAVDTPFLPLDFVARLAEAREAASASACCAMSGDRRHPVAALWPVAAREVLRDALLGEGLRRVGQFLDRLGPAVAVWPVDPYDPFYNVNAPDDVARAEAMAVQADQAAWSG